MNLFGSGHGSGIRPVSEPDKRAKQPRRAKGATKYPDELVAHAKWLLQSWPIVHVALKTGLPPGYVGQINASLIRASVQPKEMR